MPPNVLTVGCEKPNSEMSKVLLRPQKVYNALKWLKENNAFYQNIDLPDFTLLVDPPC